MYVLWKPAHISELSHTIFALDFQYAVLVHILGASPSSTCSVLPLDLLMAVLLLPPFRIKCHFLGQTLPDHPFKTECSHPPPLIILF